MSFPSNRERKHILSPAPIGAVLEGEDATILAGKFHGVTVGTEFTCPEYPDYNPLVAYEVGEAWCKAHIPFDPFPGQTRVYFSLWSSEKRLEVWVDPLLDGEFRGLLMAALGERRSSNISIIREQGEETDANRVSLRRRGPTGIDIIWPRAHQSREPLPGLKIEHPGLKEQATRSAAALAHLFRFFQLEDLKDEGASHDNFYPFHISAWNLEQLIDNGDTVKETDNEIKLWFTNTCAQDLYFMVIRFDPAFDVRKVYPDDKPLEVAQPNKCIPYTFTMDLNKELDGKGPYRNVYRVVVFDKPDTPDIPCVDYLELPTIWETLDGIQVDDNTNRREGRIITPESKHDHTLWIGDMEIFIDPKSNSQGCITS